MLTTKPPWMEVESFESATPWGYTPTYYVLHTLVRTFWSTYNDLTIRGINHQNHPNPYQTIKVSQIAPPWPTSDVSPWIACWGRRTWMLCKQKIIMQLFCRGRSKLKESGEINRINFIIMHLSWSGKHGWGRGLTHLVVGLAMLWIVDPATSASLDRIRWSL
jgi:hypothetical protein